MRSSAFKRLCACFAWSLWHGTDAQSLRCERSLLLTRTALLCHALRTLFLKGRISTPIGNKLLAFQAQGTSQIASKSRSCEIINRVPSYLSSKMKSIVSRSKWLVGSSSKRTSEGVISARARFKRTRHHRKIRHG